MRLTDEYAFNSEVCLTSGLYGIYMNNIGNALKCAKMSNPTICIEMHVQSSG